MNTPRSLSVAFIGGMLLGSLATVGAATVRGSDVFTDVQPGAYYDDAIGELYSEGIIKGLSSTRFGPGDYITRADVAVLLKRLKDELEDGSSQATSRSSRTSSSSTSSSASSLSSRSPAGAFRFTATAVTVDENESAVSLSIVRVGGAKGQVTVDYSVTPGSATADTDYEPIAGTLTFADGATSKTLTITVKDDSSSEGNETFNIELKNPTGGSQLDSGATAVVTIKDNEASSTSSTSGTTSSNSSTAVIEFGATTYTTAENVSMINITVVRSGNTSGTVSANYATANDSAQSGSAYSATTGTVTFSSGETSKIFSVPILDNGNIEGAKKFKVTLASPTGGATLRTSSAFVTILDDDSSSFTFGTGSLKFTASTATAVEGEDAVVTVIRAGGTKGTISAKYSTFPSGTVTSADYTTVSGTLTFQPGEATKTIRVPILEDSVSDPAEELQVRLTDPVNTTIQSPETITITIDQ